MSRDIKRERNEKLNPLKSICVRPDPTLEDQLEYTVEHTHLSPPEILRAYARIVRKAHCFLTAEGLFEKFRRFLHESRDWDWRQRTKKGLQEQTNKWCAKSLN